MKIYLDFLLNQIYFWVVCCTVTALYLRTILFLKRQKASQTDRLETLSKIFAVIAVTWIFCELPYALVTLLEHPLWAVIGCNDRYFNGCNPRFCANMETAIDRSKDVSAMLKNVFPFLNTVLLIALLRPLQRPFSKIGQICHRK